MKAGLVTCVAVALLAAGAHAQSPAWPEPITNRLQQLTQRFTQCSAVFSVLAFVLDRNASAKPSDAARQYLQISDLMRARAAKLAAEVNQEPEAIKAQWDAWAKRLLDEMDSQNPDVAITLSDDRESCTALHEDAARYMRMAIFGQ